MKLLKLCAVCATIALTTGCAAKGNLVNDEISASQATAQLAVEAANAANEQAREALEIAKKALAAAEGAQACCDTNKTEFADKLDRMFKKTMLK